MQITHYESVLTTAISAEQAARTDTEIEAASNALAAAAEQINEINEIAHDALRLKARTAVALYGGPLDLGHTLDMLLAAQVINALASTDQPEPVDHFRAFNFEGMDVRIQDRDGGYWFVLKDVCQALGINNSSMAASRLDDDEKGVSLTDTLGGEQKSTIINESGLYTLVLRSKDAVKEGTAAWRFRKWVTNEVLPTLRRTGNYATQAPAETTATNAEPIINTIIDRTGGIEVGALANLIGEVRKTSGRRVAGRLVNNLGLGIQSAPMDDLCDRVMQAVDAAGTSGLTMSELARMVQGVDAATRRAAVERLSNERRIVVIEQPGRGRPSELVRCVM